MFIPGADALTPGRSIMNRIRLLPEHVANQIAAGEVVERPASVIKELVENSLDAGATRITVEALAAGRGLLRVSDNGAGMSRDDALLCLERHATSKITSAGDLARITTLGFRGEAVPSIASVSRFTLTTREQGSPDTAPATRIVIHGGKILEVKEAGAPQGTTIDVRNLFFNVPARRKFLRSDATERAHIQHWLTTAALSHPEVGFTLQLEGRTVWQLPPLQVDDAPASRLHALRERLRLLVGDGLTLVPVDASGSLDAARIAPEDVSAPPEVSPPAEARIWGWIGAPGVSRSTRDDQHLFVNRRPVENRGLNAALVEGYHNALMKGRFPLCCLFLELDPGEVDVNIHPAKREVKFHRERAVRRFVAESVVEALKAWHRPEEPAPGDPTPHLPRVQRDPGPTAQSSPAIESRRGPVPNPSSTSTSTAIPTPTPSPPAPSQQTDFLAQTRNRTGPSSDRAHAGPPLPSRAPGSPEDAPPIQTDGGRGVGSGNPTTTIDPRGSVPVPAMSAPTPLLAIPLRVVGVIGRLYVVLESDRGLVLLDQHAAHERVLYEEMLRRVQNGGTAPSQRLLLPETLELPPKDAAFLRENLEALHRLGVGLSEFGERTFLLDALPPFVKAGNPRRFALELVDELRSAGSTVNTWRLGEAVVAKTVCRHAIKANDPLGPRELEALVENLRACDMPYTCPHGRPTLIEMNYRELEKRFGRVAA